MNFFLLVAVVQIVTESFPISSSGHVRLLEQLFKQAGIALHDSQRLAAFVDVMHLPTIIIIGLLLYPLWLIRKPLWQWIPVVFVVDSVTIFFYCVWHIVGTGWFPLGVGFAVSGACLASVRWCPQHVSQGIGVRSIEQLASDWFALLLLGCAQGIALLPGISRFGITYTAGRWLGLRSPDAFVVSFVVQAPLLVLGIGRGYWRLLQSGVPVIGSHGLFIAVVSASSVGAYYSLRWMYCLAVRDRLWLVAWYMMVPIAVWVLGG